MGGAASGHRQAAAAAAPSVVRDADRVGDPTRRDDAATPTARAGWRANRHGGPTPADQDMSVTAVVTSVDDTTSVAAPLATP